MKQDTHCIIASLILRFSRKAHGAGTYQIAGLDIFNAIVDDDSNTARGGFISAQFEYIQIIGQHLIGDNLFSKLTFSGLLARLDDEYSVPIHRELNPTPK
jgi:hypothetical protein